MNERVLKFPTRPATPGKIWCEPLEIFFPQVYRLRKKHDLLSTASPSRGLKTTISLYTQERYTLSTHDGPAPLGEASAVDRLQPWEDRSVIVRCHLDARAAESYLSGLAEHVPSLVCGQVFHCNGYAFTLTRRETRKSWLGARIFYVAEVFQDDDSFGSLFWERSASVDGVLSATELLYEEETADV
jgi:hypothetical protein